MLREYLTLLHRYPNAGNEICQMYRDHLHTGVSFPAVVSAVVSAAEREDGVRNLQFSGLRKRWRDSVMSGFLWYNDTQSSTHLISINRR